MHDTSILSIELRRQLAKIPKATLCRTARVNVSTYHRLLKRPGSGRSATISLLNGALAAHQDLHGATGGPQKAAGQEVRT